MEIDTTITPAEFGTIAEKVASQFARGLITRDEFVAKLAAEAQAVDGPDTWEATNPELFAKVAAIFAR